MKRRANNEGSIRQRKDGRWEAIYTAGYDAQGKQICKSVYGQTREAANEKLQAALQRVRRGEYVEPSSITVAQWLDTWFEVYGRPRWRDSTATEHYRSIENVLKPLLGKHKLQKLRHEHVQAFVNGQAEAGKAPATIRKQLEPLKGALKQALFNNLITKNPAQHLAMPYAAPKEIEFLKVDEQRKLLEALPDTTSGRALRFVLGTGLRASELCGLRWCDIEHDRFTVRQTAQQVLDLDAAPGESKHKLSIAGPKTKAGLRTIPLTEAMQRLLEEQRAAQIAARLKSGSAWQGKPPGKGEGYVFSTATGLPIDRHNLGRTLRKGLDKAGLKRRGVHALRHSFATNCIRAGVDVRTLAALIGHTQIAFTLQQYVHTDTETMRAGLDAVASMM